MKKIYNRAVLIVMALSGAAASWASGQVVYEDTHYEEFKLVADDGVSTDWFGRSVAFSPNFGGAAGTAVVGADGRSDTGNSSGAVYVYDMGTGEQIHKLVPGDAAIRDVFGYTVATSDGIVLAGAHLDDDAGASSGSAYLFDLQSGDELMKLTADDAAEGDQFGRAVALSWGVGIVGAQNNDDDGLNSGSAYLFDVSTGEQLFKLTASDAAAGDFFGASVAIYRNVAVVGAPGNDGDDGNNYGSAYIFDVHTGEELFKIVGDGTGVGGGFGSAVAVSGSGAVVLGRVPGGPGSGPVMVHVFDTSTGEQLRRFFGPGDLLTNSLSLSHSRLLVGRSGFNDFVFNSGSAVLFDITSGEHLTSFRSSDAVANDEFANAVAISGDEILIGTRLDDDLGFDSGSVYVYTRCPADLNYDGTLNFFDVTSFVDAFRSGDLFVDLNQDGFLNSFDVSAFLAAFAAGCP